MDTVSNYTETLEKTVRDLLERQEDLIRTAFTDQLTGLGNRGGFARSLEELWEQDTPRYHGVHRYRQSQALQRRLWA